MYELDYFNDDNKDNAIYNPYYNFSYNSGCVDEFMLFKRLLKNTNYYFII